MLYCGANFWFDSWNNLLHILLGGFAFLFPFIIVWKTEVERKKLIPLRYALFTFFFFGRILFPTNFEKEVGNVPRYYFHDMGEFGNVFRYDSV